MYKKGVPNLLLKKFQKKTLNRNPSENTSKNPLEKTPGYALGNLL